MKFVFNVTLTLVFGVISIALNVAQGQNLHLVKDINNQSSSYPSCDKTQSFTYNTYTPFAVMNGISYFTASDGIHGAELWRSDGTTGGTSLVKDIAPGITSSGPQRIIVFNNKLFFSAKDSSSVKLWVSDGTSTGTKLFMNVSSTVIKQAGIQLFFVSNNQLWKSDGTTAGTNMVIDFNLTTTGYLRGSIQQLFSINEKLYFSVLLTSLDGFSGKELLWISDGTTAGTHAVNDVALQPDQLVAGPGNLIFFSASTAENFKRRLWSLDPQTGVADYASGDNNFAVSRRTPIINRNNTLYYSGSADGLSYNTLYRYEAGSASVVKTIPTIDANAGIHDLAAVGESIFFEITINYGGIRGYHQLWRSDGSTSGTTLLTDSCYSTNFSDMGGVFYFSGAKGNEGLEPWKSDGTTEGTFRIKDINPGYPASLDLFCSFTKVNNTIIFAAKDSISGMELWKTDGTGAGTTLVKDINKTVTGYAGIMLPTAAGKQLFFGATNGISTDLQLWTSDGTESGTTAVSQISPDPLTDMNNLGFGVRGNDIYFFGYNPVTRIHGMYKWDNSSKETVLLKTVEESYTEYLWIIATGNCIYYAFRSGFSKKMYSLWSSDGTPEGTIELLHQVDEFAYDLVKGRKPVPVGNLLFFSRKINNGFTLWKTDGSVEGTVMVNKNAPIYEPSNLCAFKGALFFITFGGIKGYDLYKTDGTEAGTEIVKQGWWSFRFTTVSGGRLFFSASQLDDQDFGEELWVSDGSTSGTVQVKDINPGSESSGAAFLTNVNGVLYFIANGGMNKEGLWKSDGTEAGTSLVKDLPGYSLQNLGSYYYDKIQTVVNGRLFLILNDSLWESDGTTAGTKPMTDAVLNDLSFLKMPSGAGNNLYFVAQNSTTDRELYGGAVASAYAPSYIFNGSGKFSDAVNWSKAAKPPTEIPEGVEVIIDPAANGQCIVDVPIAVNGGKLTIRNNAKVIVQAK